MDSQFAEFLIPALIAGESLLVSVFGSLYTVYGGYMASGRYAPICATLRWLCALLTLVIALCAALAGYANQCLMAKSPNVPEFVIWGVDAIVALIVIPAVVITWRMFKDAAP